MTNWTVLTHSEALVVNMRAVSGCRIEVNIV